MNTLSSLINQHIIVEEYGKREPSITIIESPISLIRATEPAKYEDLVFNFLLENKATLGVQSIMRFENLLIDGAIILLDGRRLAVEIKFQMNWLKACQAEWQLRHFLKTNEAKTNPVDGAIVFFEKFSGDWGIQAKSRKAVNGWTHWYKDYAEIEERRVDLLMLRGDKLIGSPLRTHS